VRRRGSCSKFEKSVDCNNKSWISKQVGTQIPSCPIKGICLTVPTYTVVTQSTDSSPQPSCVSVNLKTINLFIIIFKDTKFKNEFPLPLWWVDHHATGPAGLACNQALQVGHHLRRRFTVIHKLRIWQGRLNELVKTHKSKTYNDFVFVQSDLLVSKLRQDATC